MNIHSNDPTYLANKNFYENYTDKMKSTSILIKCLVQKYMINYNNKNVKKENDNNLNEVKDENSILLKNNNKEEEKEKIMEPIVPKLEPKY